MRTFTTSSVSLSFYIRAIRSHRMISLKGTFQIFDATEKEERGGDVDSGEECPKNKLLLDKDKLILRGAQLRNTDAIFGIVVYTGKCNKTSYPLQSSFNDF